MLGHVVAGEIENLSKRHLSDEICFLVIQTTKLPVPMFRGGCDPKTLHTRRRTVRIFFVDSWVFHDALQNSVGVCTELCRNRLRRHLRSALFLSFGLAIVKDEADTNSALRELP